MNVVWSVDQISVVNLSKGWKETEKSIEIRWISEGQMSWMNPH